MGWLNGLAEQVEGMKCVWQKRIEQVIKKTVNAQKSDIIRQTHYMSH